ncbi:MAG TPA: hypothetical protein VEF04_17740 [Blastocatellia bacterium]|nr:hypothetical protein [Blastocatellia bacterium]
MFEVVATIKELGTDAVGCFDPTKVILRLTAEMPEVIVCLHDYAWKDYDGLLRIGAGEAAMRVAESDALGRGPIYLFRLRTGNHQVINGVAERYRVRITSEQEIPEELKQKFLAFLQSLKLDPIEVKSVRWEGNAEYPV